jgi:hypothetical protein
MSEYTVLTEEQKLKWYKIIFALKNTLGKKPDMNGLLFLIGVRELGIKKNFSKEEKLDLMHIATCKLLSFEGYYAYTHTDDDGWPHYQLLKKPAFTDLSTQENLLKKLVVQYFEESGLID